MSDPITCDVLIIGAGPGGYVCAIRAGQLGLDTMIVEAGAFGGTCLNVGCIPSKALIHAADEFSRVRRLAGANDLGISTTPPSIDMARTMDWKTGIVQKLAGGVGSLLKRARVKSLRGQARFLDGKTVRVDTDTGGVEIRARRVVVATGSAPVALPGLPFGGRVISSTEALDLSDVPARFAVVGAGYIGLEIGMAYAKLGSSVTVVEAGPRILPQYDQRLTAPVLQRLKELGVEVLTEARAEGLSDDGEALRVSDASGARRLVEADRILVAVGRRPRTGDCGLEELSLAMDGPFLRVDSRLMTSMRDVYAIGDVTGEPMLAHRAMAQGECLAEILAGRNRVWEDPCIPSVCFTDPEIVVAGLSPDEAKTGGKAILEATFPFSANGRSLAVEAQDGFVRVIADETSHQLLGIQAVGNGVAELSASFSALIEMGGVLEDVSSIVHAHPTQSEALQEAALKALGHAIHI